MTTFLDVQFGMKKESAYGTAVTVDRFYEFLSAPFKLDKTIVQGAGMRAGSRVARSARRVVPFSSTSGELEMEVPTKGMGVLWEACMGAGVSNLVSTGLYQQVHAFADAQPSYTCQVGVFDGTAVKPFTYDGCQVASWSLEASEAEILKLKVSFVGQSLSTAGSVEDDSYPASMGLFTFAHAAFYAGGTLTAPTTTALGSSSGSALAVVKSLTLNVDNQLKDGPQVSGLPTERKPGLRAISGTVTAEYSGSTFVDAIIADSAMLLIATFTNDTDVVQAIVPEIKLDGDLPAPAGNERITYPLNFQGLDNLSATQPLWIVTRTADTAL